MSQTPIYTIAKWEYFEHRTVSARPANGMGWYPHTTSLNNKGAVRLIRKGASGYAAIVVFERIVAWHCQLKKCRRTGALVESDGAAIPVEDIADEIGMPPEDVEESLQLLCSANIGWMSTSEFGSQQARSEISANSQRVHSEPDASSHRGRIEPTVKSQGTRIEPDANSLSIDSTDNTDRNSDSSNHLSKSAKSDSDSQAENENHSIESRTKSAWNAFRESRQLGWSVAQKLSAASAKNLADRKKECGGIEEFGTQLTDRLRRMAASSHYRGENDNNWMPSLPWLLQKAANWEKAGGLPTPEDLNRARSSRPARQAASDNIQIVSDDGAFDASQVFFPATDVTNDARIY